MPSAKVVAERLFEGNGLHDWSPSDQLEEIRGKVHLKGKDKDAYREGTNIEKSLYESAILQYRKNNKSLRKELKEKENGDDYVITTALKDDRERRLSMANLTAQNALTEMDQRVCEAGRALDLWRYERAIREEELEKLKWELEYSNELEEEAPEDVAAKNDVIRLENATDKVIIKLNTAKILAARYREIINRFKTDSMSMPRKLDAMETALVHTKGELEELKNMSKEAFVLRDKGNEQLHQMQQETFEARRVRMALLEETREEVERRKEELQIKERTLRAPRPTLTGESADYKAAMEMSRKQTMQKRILDYQAFFNRIKEATHASELEEVIARIVKQDGTHKGLKKQVHQLEHQRTRLSEDRNSLERKFREMKYSGEQKLSRGQRVITDFQDLLHESEKKNNSIRDDVKRSGETIINVREAVVTLLEKLNEVKLPSPEHSYPRGDVFNQLDLAQKKLERLMRDVGATSGETSMKEKLHNPEFQEFLLKRVGPDNIRIKLQPSALGLHDFQTEQYNEGALTRHEIKLQGQRMMDSRVKPKKKKPSRKK